jgi:hypothetical protein
MNLEGEETETTNDTDTSDTPAQDTANDAGAAAAETKPETGVAAFDKGLEELPASEGGVKAAEADKPVPGATGAAPAKTEAGATAAAAPAKDLTDEEKAKQVKAAVADAELRKFNDELRAGGSKPLAKKAADRFRELSMRPTEEEVKQQLEKVRAEFAPREELAAKAERFDGIIAETQANPQQLGSVFMYLGDINSGDPTRMKRALDSMRGEVAWLAGQLGEQVEGFDPLEAHQDLKQMVAEGDMKMAAALEVVKARASKKLHDERTNATTAATQSQQEYAAAIQKRDTDFAALDAHFKKTDPHYSEKLPLLAPVFRALKRKDAQGNFIVHPSQWAPSIKEAYAEIKLPAKPAVAASPSPVRATGTTAPVVKIPKGGLAAFDMGLEKLKEEAA